MKHTFIVSDENVNNYGFRVMTAGIDTTQYEKNPIVLFMHKRGNVIGRADKLYKQDGQLLADVEFDMDDPEAAKIAGKVERGFLKMTSVWIQHVDSSDDTAMKLVGQDGPTITKSKLKEISIVDIGANDEALKLFDQAGKEIKLSDFPKLSNQNQDKMSKFKNIALAMGLDENAEEGAVLTAISDMKTKNQANESKLADIEAAEKATQKAEAIKLTDKAIELEIIPASFKENQIKLFDTDHDNQKALLEAEIAKKDKGDDEDTDAGSKLSDEAKDFLGGLGKGQNPDGSKLSFEDLSKNNPEKLAQIEEHQPKLFERLLNEYVKD